MKSCASHGDMRRRYTDAQAHVYSASRVFRSCVCFTRHPFVVCVCGYVCVRGVGGGGVKGKQRMGVGARQGRLVRLCAINESTHAELEEKDGMG